MGVAFHEDSLQVNLYQVWSFSGSHMTMLPGLVPITLFFLALALTSDLTVTELESGVLARDWVHGVNTLHSLVCQVAVQLIVVTLQV